jgi:hypothetical protein
MAVLQIEHRVRDFDSWKAAFDSDPVGRERGGVRSYRIMHSARDPNLVLIELELDGVSEAEAFLERLRELWGRIVEEGLIEAPTARIAEEVESRPSSRSAPSRARGRGAASVAARSTREGGRRAPRRSAPSGVTR